MPLMNLRTFRVMHLHCLLAIFAFSMICAPVIAAQTPTKVVEYGRYSTEVKELLPDENSSGGVEVVANGAKHIETTSVIPNRLGECFGFRLRLLVVPVNRARTLKVVVQHPPIRQPNGKVLKTEVSESEIPAGSGGLGEQLLLWHFLEGYEYELKPGEWTWRVFVDEEETASKTFEVVSVEEWETRRKKSTDAK